MYDVITIGSNTMDLFVHTDRSEIIDIRSKSGSEEFISYPAGTKMLITKLMHNFGGNGANSAVTFSRLGFRTAYIGEIGKDQNGNTILKHLKKEKIDFLGARGEQSGLSIILDSIEEDRTILVYKGCNNDLRYSKIKLPRLRTKWLYLSSMLGESLLSMQRVAEHARKKKAKIAFNPSSTMLENETQKAIDMIRYAEVLVLNREEAETLVGKNIPEVNIQKLLVFGPKVVAITDGKNGAVGYKDGFFYRVGARQDLKIVETTGAGDAFASTFTAGIILNKPFDFCLKMAINNAESVISHHGAQNTLLSRKKLFEAVNKDKRVIEKRKA
jgi:ribokinase